MGDNQLAIIGLHDPILLNMQTDLFGSREFDVKTAVNLSAMVELVKQNPDARIYLMDVNLGFPARSYGQPCHTVWEIVKEFPGSVLVGCTGTQGAIDDAVRRGVPRECLVHLLDLRWDYIEQRLRSS